MAKDIPRGAGQDQGKGNSIARNIESGESRTTDSNLKLNTGITDYNSIYHIGGFACGTQWLDDSERSRLYSRQSRCRRRSAMEQVYAYTRTDYLSAKKPGSSERVK
jgi:hypothetical protein